MRKMVKYEDFQKGLVRNLHCGDKMRKMVKYGDFEKARFELCTTEKKSENNG